MTTTERYYASYDQAVTAAKAEHMAGFHIVPLGTGYSYVLWGTGEDAHKVLNHVASYRRTTRGYRKVWSV